MKRAQFLLTSGSALLATRPAQASGRTYFEAFPSAPFPHASRAHGHRYQGKLYDAPAHYSDATTALYIPQYFRPSPLTDFVVHFHGWNNDVRNVLDRYRMREQMDSSERNAILVVPQGPKDAPDSGDGKLELDENGFARFMRDVATWLARNRIIPSDAIGRIVLTMHSGGYGGAGGALARGGMNAVISDVILFDAAYGYYDAFANWAKASPQNHLLSAFTDDTSTGNTALMAMVQAPQSNIFVRLGDSLTPGQLQTRAPTFVLTTSIAHDDLLTARNWYAVFLRTTLLSATA